MEEEIRISFVQYCELDKKTVFTPLRDHINAFTSPVVDRMDFGEGDADVIKKNGMPGILMALKLTYSGNWTEIMAESGLCSCLPPARVIGRLFELVELIVQVSGAVLLLLQ